MFFVNCECYLISFVALEYYFVDRPTMEASIANNEFIEYAEYSGNLYGTRFDLNYILVLGLIYYTDFNCCTSHSSKKSVKDVLDTNKICVLDIDVQGVISVKNTDLNPKCVFIKPPSLEVLVSIRLFLVNLYIF